MRLLLYTVLITSWRGRMCPWASQGADESLEMSRTPAVWVILEPSCYSQEEQRYSGKKKKKKNRRHVYTDYWSEMGVDKPAVEKMSANNIWNEWDKLNADSKWKSFVLEIASFNTFAPLVPLCSFLPFRFSNHLFHWTCVYSTQCLLSTHISHLILLSINLNFFFPSLSRLINNT